MNYNWKELNEVIRFWVFSRLNKEDLENYHKRKEENDAK
jgi:hypothetical protein